MAIPMTNPVNGDPDIQRYRDTLAMIKTPVPAETVPDGTIPTIKPQDGQLPTIAGPDLSAFQQPKPLVKNPREQREERMRAQIADYETPKPATGFWGKTGRILSGIGNVAGDIFAPRIMEDIPGTWANKREQYGENVAQLRNLESQDEAEKNEFAKRELEQAQTAKLEEPPEAAAQKPITLTTDKGIFQWSDGHWMPVQYGGETLNPPEHTGAPKAFQHVAGTSGGKDVFANYDPNKGVFTDLEGNTLKDFKPKDKALQGAYGGFGPAFLAYRMLNSAYNENPALLPYISPLISKMLSASGGGAPPGIEDVLGTTPEGQPLSPTTGHPIGLRMPSAPTGATRTQAQTAQRVLDELPRIKSEVTDAAENLGPVKGRLLVRYLLGAAGSTGDPETDEKLSQLRTDLMFVGSGSAKFHINSVRQAEAYEHLLDAGKSPAEALQGTLASITDWAHTASQQGLGYGEKGPTKSKEPERPANVPKGYVFKSGPKGKGWYKP